MTKKYQNILQLMHREVIPAIGCTEPIAVALCVAKARENLGALPDKIHVTLSPNIYKNAMSVGIPNTGMHGLPIAIALGATIGRSEWQLEVLRDTTPETVEQAKKYLARTDIHIDITRDIRENLYIHVEVQAGGKKAEATIAGSHTHFVDNRDVLAQGQSPVSITDEDPELSLREVWEFANNVELSDLDFLREAAELNMAAAEESFQTDCGHGLGRLLHEKASGSLFGDTLYTKILAYTSGACDARMSGAMVPVMSNSGSGNQGISCTVPVVIYGRETGASEEAILRALAMSHLTVIYIKQSLGRLSALCGCVVAAMGSTCGITRLMGGSYEQVTYAVKNMVANISGMICDGAKPGCALKVTSGVSTAVLSAVLAMENRHSTAIEGIVDEDVDQSIHNLTSLGKTGMHETDKMILDIMVNKG